jgi:hypothetical protein
MMLGNDNKIVPDNSENNLDESSKQLVKDGEVVPATKPLYFDNKPIIEVDDDESKLDARIVYWAANLGELAIVKAAIDLRRMSPFIKCFKKRNMISAAVIGGKSVVLKFILSYRYKAADTEDIQKLRNMLLE